MTDSIAYIERLPFARGSIVRRISDARKDCTWCGRVRPSGKLFEYGFQADDSPGRIGWNGKSFCCKDCRDAYYC